MSDAILNGDVTVAYLDEARNKRIYWTGGENTYTMNQLYSALMDHFDEPARMDNPSPMSAETPVEYTTGVIDVGDTEPWYITYRLMEHMTGGALRTSGWTRDLPGNGTGDIGIIVIPVASGGSITYTDEGDTLSHASTDSGTLLEFIDTGGSTDYLVVRPDTNTLADDFNDSSGTITMGTSANTATQNAIAVTGEQIWANLYAIGTIENDTHIYLYQGAVNGAARTRVYAQNSATTDYWPNGLFDVCVPIRDYTTASAPIIDGGYLTAFARKTTTEYSFFTSTTSTTSGGRNPVPLGTKSDLNQATGTGNVVWDNGSIDTLVDLERLYLVGTTTAGNIDAGIQDDGGVFTNDTTDLNDIGGAGDVPVHPATTANNDAFYFGMTDKFEYLLVDVTTAATATGAGTTWEYYDGTTWSALTVTDDSDGGNGFATNGTGRFVLSWTAPTDWTPTTVTNQPATLVKPYYIRIRVSNNTNYTVGATLETAWAAGFPQLKAIVRDDTITGAGSATGNTDYYLIGEPQQDFSDNDVVIAATSRKSFDVNGAPTAQGPALATWFTNNAFPSISFTAQTFDVDDDSVVEYYGIDIDCNSNPLTEVYEWLKYILRNGGTTTANSDGIEGEQYVGGTAMLAYTVNDAGDLAEGDYVTQEITGASGIIVSLDETGATNYILLRDTRGTFEVETAAGNRTVTNASTGSIEINSAVANFAPNAVSPFGTFAGGTFFGARGVLLSNWVSADENSFQLTPIEGGTKSRPQAITLTVSNLVGTGITTATDDRVAIYRLSGGVINKTEYSAAGGETPGTPTLVVDTGIAQDVPGKTTGGTLVIRDADDDNTEYYIRYSSWATSTFTLANFAAFVTTATTNTTQITYATGGFNAAVRRGDLVYNSTVGATSYVKTVDSDTQLTIEPAITGQTTGDTVEINCVPITVNTADDVYIPLMSRYAAGSTESVSIVYSTQIDFRVVARNSANATKIKPFTTDDTTTGTDRSNSVVRNTDTIIT